MVDVLRHVFSTFIAKGGQVSPVSGGPPSPRSALVVGDSTMSRSVLLLAALTAASSRRGMKVLFFTRTQIQTLPPSVTGCLPNLSPDSLKVIVIVFFFSRQKCRIVT